MGYLLTNESRKLSLVMLLNMQTYVQKEVTLLYLHYIPPHKPEYNKNPNIK